jgi:hypothetical protein
MKNDRHSTPWSRLTAAARRAPMPSQEFAGDVLVPVGFATRVVAQAGLRPSAGLFGALDFERLAGRAFGLACAGALAVTVWAGAPSSVEARPSETTASIDAYLDPVGAIIEVVQS